MSVTVDKTVTINAPIADVLAIVRDVDRQSEWFPGNLVSEVTEKYDDGLVKRAHMVNDVKIAKDEFDLDYTHTDTTMSWSLVAPSKSQKDQNGTWTLVDKGAATEATFSLTVDSSLPVPGFMQKKVIKGTANDATDALKKRAEA